MVFIANKPNATDKLKDSQPVIKGNFQQLDASFLVDHYTFSNGTTNNGKHNQVTTPEIVGAAHPTTAAAEPKFYAMNDADQVGVIQYSRGPSDAVPSPLTRLHGVSVGVASGATIDIFDYGTPDTVTRSISYLSAYGEPITSASRLLTALVCWTGADLRTWNIIAGNTIAAVIFATVDGSKIQIKNNTAVPLTIYWSLEFQRLQ